MFRPLALIAVAAFLAGGASAQTAAPARSGGLGSLLGGRLPSIGSVGVGNAAGLLGYCLKNNLLGQAGALAASMGDVPAAPATGAQGILERLTGRQGVQSSPGYAAGQAGQVQTPGGQALSLDGVRGQVKSQVCKLVLNRARSFL